jgi:hypothetical protein
MTYFGTKFFLQYAPHLTNLRFSIRLLFILIYPKNIFFMGMILKHKGGGFTPIASTGNAIEGRRIYQNKYCQNVRTL